MSVTREAWLRDAADWAAATIFDNPSLAGTVKASCGWPSAGGLSKKSRTVGQCWDTVCSAGGINEIFISPYLGDQLEVMTTLVHEMVHAEIGVDKKHGKVFVARAKAVGLVKPWRSTPASANLLERFADYLVGRDPYPHKALDPQSKGRTKAPSTRYSAVCSNPACEYTFKLAKKIADMGVPPKCVCGSDLRLNVETEAPLDGEPQ